MENYAEPLVNKYNMIAGAIIAVFSYIFGENWYLFAAFLIMNVIDEFTGWYKSYINHKESSEVGWRGILKKLFYWVMIGFAFLMARVFIGIGDAIGINLQVTTLLGWFVLASLFINEIRSIIENLVEADIYVPSILKKGLEVADKVMKEAEEAVTGEDDEDNA